MLPLIIGVSVLLSKNKLVVASNLTRYGYTGREWDVEANLYYYRARWYDSHSGRFISEDPIGLEGGVNLYSYVGNNPTGFIDPAGTQRAEARGFTKEELESAAGMRRQMASWQQPKPPMYPDNFDWWGAFSDAFYERGCQNRQWLEDKINEILNDPGLHFALIGVGPLTNLAADLSAGSQLRVATSGARIEATGSGLGKLVSLGNGQWKSTAGLIYGQGSKQGNRILHVLEHALENLSRINHSVFVGGRSNVLPLIDEAWSMRGLPLPNDPGAYIVPMGRAVGIAGEQSIRIIVRPGTSELITAYPVF